MSEPPLRIRRLPDHLVNKIAAGEVVERPASAVKELVENSLDAEARSITVDLRDGGSALLRVIDDGIGMSAAELVLALERHATSKLRDDADLDAIATLGFRGEALPAICAVSRFTITSRAREAAAGMRLAGAGGAIDQRLTVPANQGTSVEVSDLFFNTPARLKFLKSAAAELSASLRTLGHLALAHPTVHLRVTNNGRAVLTAPGAEDHRARVGALWGYPLADRLLGVDRGEHGVLVQGLASPPDVTRGSRDDIAIVVNGRPVRDPALLQAVLAAYRPLLPRDRFPMVVLALTLSPTDVDANVHPTKAWVRFRHPGLVHEMLVAAIGEALRRQVVVPRVTTGPSSSGAAAVAAAVPASGAVAAAGEQAPLWAETAAPYGQAEFGRVLGQVQQTIIVTSSDREVFFLDQHAAHERVVFERLKAEVAEGPASSQTLLFPETIHLDPASLALLERWREPLEHLGFAFDGAGGQQIILRAIPTALKGDEPRRLVEAAVEELTGSKPGEPILDRALSFVACHAAIKANTPLEPEEMERIVTELAATPTPYFCPHGRPTVSRISLGDIRRELRRTW